ncbi:putative O-glycosylation ligase, exosortase A system-associated [Roseomonas sp. CCTCC AB2023176]|uniref:putative O-glycosylation ligase, exosortase A system-associated n=1 Tax=Roseomonas sp. CCTCC AB2023176 TaxID=3342640 RepID=UPI0035D84E7A
MRSLVFIAATCPLLLATLAQPFLGILLWSWISFMNPHREVWGFAMNLPWAMMVLGATLVGCIVAREPKRFPANAVTLLFLLLAVLFTITTMTGLGTETGAWDKWDRTMKVIIGLLLTASLLTTRHRLHAMIWLMVLALGYYGVRGGLFTLATGGGYRVHGPELTMIADNNHVGAAMLVVLPLMNWLRVYAKHRIVRIGLAIAMGCTLFGILGTQSRGALVGLAAVACVFWLRSRHKMIGGAIMAAALVAGISFMPQKWADRMNTIGAYQADESAMTRLELWGISLKLALDRPLVGAGFRGPYTRSAVDRVEPGGPARAVHSIWFETLGEHGFPTFFAWVGLTVAGLWYTFRLTRLAKGRPELAWAGDLGRMIQVSIVAYCTAGTFLSLAYWDFYWTLLIVAPAALAIAQRSTAAVTLPAGRSWGARLASPAPAWARTARANP